LTSPCGTPSTTAHTRISQIGEVSPNRNSSAHAIVWARAPTTSFPRMPARRPVIAETAIPIPKTGSNTSPATSGESPRPSSNHWVKP